MYAKCVRCGGESAHLVDTENGTTETRCRKHLDTDEVTRTINHKRSVIPLSEKGSGTTFKTSCHMCGKAASYVIRFKDGLDVYTTEARCQEHVIDKGTKHRLEDIDVRAEDCS